MATQSGEYEIDAEKVLHRLGQRIAFLEIEKAQMQEIIEKLASAAPAAQEVEG